MAELGTAVTLLLATLGLDGTVFPSQTKLTDNATYDYIIVGGGTAGCVLARRLAEDKNCSVLVLEAGGDPTGESLLPGLFSTLPKTELDYDYQSTFDNYAASSQGNYTRLTSGKALGGSSVLNHFLYIRGVAQDYDEWANITGDDSWSYDKLLPFFIKSETLYDEKVLSTYPSYHGTDGPIGITRQLHNDEVAEYLEALNELGDPTEVDLNGPINVGYAQPLLTIAKGLRQTPSYVYLNSIKDYANLHVSKHTQVTKIVIENETAVAVEAVYENDKYTFKANKEIIISAGVFNTPKILKLSGIGPKDELEQLDIDVVSDLPVGENLIVLPAVCIVHKTNKYLLPVPDPIKLAEALDLERIPFPLLIGSGALNKSENIPNYQTYNLIFAHDTSYITVACESVYGYETDICTSLQKQAVSRDTIYTVLVGLDIESRGTVRLNSTNPSDQPLITTGFYNNSKDLDKMVNNFKDFISIVNTTTFKNVDAAFVSVDLPKCADEEYGSDDYWRCYILSMNISPFLYMGTSAMGTVVDGDLKVIGVDRLRVIDASVFPKPMHGAINAAVIALAEKGADKIKNSA